MGTKLDEFYPCEYKNIVFNSDEEVSNYTGFPVKIIKTRRYNLGKSISDIIETPYTPKSQKHTSRHIKNFYPCEYKNIVFNSDKEVSDYTGYSEEIIKDRRVAQGKSINEIIETPVTFRANVNLLDALFPCDVFGVHYDNAQEFCDKNNFVYGHVQRYIYRGKSLEEYLSSKQQRSRAVDLGVRSSSVLNSNIKSSAFWLCNIVFMPSLSEAFLRFGVPNKRKTTGETVESFFIKTYINHRIENYKGYIIPNLDIEEFVWSTEDLDYYRCKVKGTIEYLSGKDIVTKRLKYIEFVDSIPIEMYDGKYLTRVSACRFYGVSRATVEQKVTRTGISYEDSIFEACKVNKFVSSDGYIINGVSDKEASRLKVSVKDIRKIQSGEMSLKEAQEKKAQSNKDRKSETINEPIFKEREVVGYKRRRFKYREEVYKYYNLSSATVGRKVSEGKPFSDAITELLIERRNKMIFLFGSEFTDYVSMCKELELDNNRVRYLLGARDEKIEDILCQEYFSPNLFKKAAGVKFINGTFVVCRLGFKDSSDTSNNYLFCKELDKTTGIWRGKYLTGYQIFNKLVENYRDKKGL